MTRSGPAWLVQVFTRCLVRLPTTGSPVRATNSGRIVQEEFFLAMLMDVGFGTVARRGRHLLRQARTDRPRGYPAFHEKRRIRINQTAWKTDTC